MKVSSIYKSFTSIFCIIGLFGTYAIAAQMDVNTRVQLIDKFQRVYDQLADEEPAKINVTLRLADLLAEQGRYISNEELGKGCEVCTGGEEERKRALAFYEETATKLDADRQASVQIQIGHLKEMLGQETAAIESYKKAIAVAVNPALLNEAQFSLAEIFFKRRQFEEAVTYYTLVVSHPDKRGKRGLSAYRKAWSLFNMGSYGPATEQLVTILKTPDLLSRGTNNGIVSVDMNFQDEVSRDYVIFSSKNGYTAKDFDTLFDLSRQETRLDHIFNLADELERMGQNDGAIDVWSKLIKKLSDPVKKWEAHVRYANLLRATKNNNEALNFYEKGLALSSRQKECKTEQCDEIRSRERSFVLDWNKEIKNGTDKDLARAYEIYNKFNTSMDTEYWGAEAWLKLGEKQKAFDGFKKAVAKYDAKEVAAEKADKQKSLNDMLENSLLKRVEIAEELKLASLPEVYKEYMAVSKSKSQQFQVQYQMAHLNYENKKYVEAQKDFINFIESTTSNDKEAVKLKEMAGDLALDALVLAKRDDLIPETAKTLAKLLPQKAKEYDQVVVKATINQSISVASNDSVDSSKKALKILKDGDFSNASLDEKKLITKNKLLLAERAGEVTEANGYVDQYLLLPNLTEDEKQFAYKKKAWLSELVFDFKGALAATENIKDLKEPSRTLQLALLTDLSGGDPTALFASYVVSHPTTDEAIDMAMELLKKSKTPWTEFAKYQKTYLVKTDKWKDAIMLSYSRDQNQTELAKYLTWDNSDAKKRVEYLQTVLLKPVQKTWNDRLTALTVDTSSQGKMTQSLTKRIDEIKKYEQYVSQVLKAELWFGQIYALDLLSKESKRFYDEVMSLPIPEELSPEEQEQYMGLLAQNASPFLTKHNQINTKLEEILGEKKAVEQTFAALRKESPEVQQLWVNEYKGLGDIGSADFKTFVEAQVAGLTAAESTVVVKGKPQSKDITLDQLMKIKSKVMQAPFDKNILGELLTAEKQRKQDQMVIYLEQRLSKLENIKKEAVK